MAPDEPLFATLCLGADLFAVPVAMVREILDYHNYFCLPQGRSYLLGLIDALGRPDFIRCLAKRSGDIIVVPDLERIFTIGCGAQAATSTQH